GRGAGRERPARDRAPGSMDHAARGPFELVDFERVAQLLEGASLDLSHPLARDPEMLSSLGQGARHPIEEAVPDAQDLLLPLTEGAQEAVQLLVLELDLDQALDRRGGLPQILGRELLEGFQARALVDRAQSGDQRRQALGARRRDAELGPDLVHARLAAEARPQRALGAVEAAHLLEHLDRDANRARLLRQAAQDRLPDPDRRVGAEA